MSKFNYFSLYHLTLASDLYFPELEMINDMCPEDADVIIQRSIINDRGINNGKVLTSCLQASHDEVWLHIEDVAKFSIVGGNTIHYEPIDQNKTDALRLFLLGSCMGALLMQRRLLILHGNALRFGDEAIICVGHSGAGKSTLAAGFMQRGYEIIADDICAINQKLCIMPGIPRIKLWKDSADKLGIATSQLPRIREGIDKFHVPLKSQACKTALPVKAVYALETHNQPQVNIRITNGLTSMRTLIEHTYRRGFIQGMGLLEEHLYQCKKISENIPVFHIKRPTKGFALPQLINQLISTNNATRITAHG